MKKVLVIEPDNAIREEYRELLGAAGYEAHTASDGKAGLDIVWREQPDCVLLEILLPKIDGFEVLRQIRKNSSTEDMPVILFTELGHEDDIARARHLGCNDYCVKARHSTSDVVKKVQELFSS